MQIFEIHEIKFLAPLTLIAEDEEHAADLFIEAMVAGFGNRPDLLYKMQELQPSAKTAHGKSLLYLAAGDDAGVAWKGARTWQLCKRLG
jgi:hypothetical protein